MSDSSTSEKKASNVESQEPVQGCEDKDTETNPMTPGNSNNSTTGSDSGTRRKSSVALSDKFKADVEELAQSFPSPEEEHPSGSGVNGRWFSVPPLNSYSEWEAETLAAGPSATPRARLSNRYRANMESLRLSFLPEEGSGDI